MVVLRSSSDTRSLVPAPEQIHQPAALNDSTPLRRSRSVQRSGGGGKQVCICGWFHGNAPAAWPASRIAAPLTYSASPACLPQDTAPNALFLIEQSFVYLK